MRTGLSPRRSSRLKRSLAALCLCSLLSLPNAFAQSLPAPDASPSPSVASSASEVNREGYSLKPTGLATNEWPNLRIDFSIERADRTIFKNLTLADVEPKVDGQRIPTREGDLKQKESEGSGVLILLDGSGSMASEGLDKLSAAKQALKTLIDNLNANDKVGLLVFDEEPRVIVTASTDKEAVKREIDGFTIRKDKSRFTRLYDAVDFGMRHAKENQIQNLLLISDGWEDTPESRLLSATELAAFKARREQSITQYSRNNDIRVFTVAIGNEHGEGLTYVDRAALDNISKGANGGTGAYIELLENSQTKALKQSDLLERLQQTLDNLRQSFRYSYSLTVHVDQSLHRNSSEHILWVGFSVGDTPRIQLPIEYTYALSTAGAPVVKGVKVQPAIFIHSAPRTVTWQQLLLIYLLLLSGLMVLLFIPTVGRTISRGGESLRLRKAIVTVGNQSPLVGCACPNEGTASGRAYLIKEGDIVLVCPKCKTPHHLSCWHFNEHHCMQRTCELKMIIPSQVLEKYGLLEPEFTQESYG